MKNRVFAMLAVYLTVTLSGCATDIACEVLSYHQLPPPRGETIRIEPKTPDQTGNFFFNRYADLIRTELSELGYTPVTGIAESDLIARVGYGVSEGELVIQSWPTCSVRYHFIRRSYYAPYWYGYRCWDRDIYTYTKYMRYLDIDIVRLNNAGTVDEVLFEGRAQNLGRDNELVDIMPYLVTAMFTNFPGESGVSKTITIDEESLTLGAAPTVIGEHKSSGSGCL